MDDYGGRPVINASLDGKINRPQMAAAIIVAITSTMVRGGFCLKIERPVVMDQFLDLRG